MTRNRRISPLWPSPGERVNLPHTCRSQESEPSNVRVPQCGIAKFFGTLCQLDQLRRGQRIGKPKHPFLTEIHSPLREKPWLITDPRGHVFAIAQMIRQLHLPRGYYRPHELSQRAPFRLTAGVRRVVIARRSRHHHNRLEIDYPLTQSTTAIMRPTVGVHDRLNWSSR